MFSQAEDLIRDIAPTHAPFDIFFIVLNLFSSLLIILDEPYSINYTDPDKYF